MQVDALLGTQLNSLNLATEGKSLRIKTWHSHPHDSGSSMRPIFDQRTSEDSQQTQSPSRRRSRSTHVPARPSSITAEERVMLDNLADNDHETRRSSEDGKRQLSFREHQMINEILTASMEADVLAAEMEAEASGGIMQFGSRDDEKTRRFSTGTEPPGDWEFNNLIRHPHMNDDSASQQHSLMSSSEFSVSSIESDSTATGLSPAAIRISVTPRRGRTLSVLQPEKVTQFENANIKSLSSIPRTGPHEVHASWQHPEGVNQDSEHMLGTDLGLHGAPPKQWPAAESAMDEGSHSMQPDHTGGLTVRSNYGWQPLSPVNVPEEQDLFPENLMLTEQEDFGLLRNQLAQVLPEENLDRRLGAQYVTEQHSRDGTFQCVEGMLEQQLGQVPQAIPDGRDIGPDASNGQLLRYSGVPHEAEEQDPMRMDTSR